MLTQNLASMRQYGAWGWLAVTAHLRHLLNDALVVGTGTTRSGGARYFSQWIRWAHGLLRQSAQNSRPKCASASGEGRRRSQTMVRNPAAARAPSYVARVQCL